MKGVTMNATLTFLFMIFCGLLLIVINKKLLMGKKRYIHAFNNIYEQLKCRHDIIPNLIDASSVYLSRDQAAITAVSCARQRAEAVLSAASANLDENSVSSLGAVETELNEALSNLQSVIKTYPELKKDKLIIDLMDILESSGNRVAYAKRNYNNSAVSYNEMRRAFPVNIVAGFLGHGRKAALLSFEDNTDVRMTSRILL